MRSVKMLIVTLSAATLLFASCGQEEINYVSVAEAQQIIPGTWKVYYYGDDNGGTADQFTDYTFVFLNDGTVTATTGLESYQGTWIIQASSDEFYDQELVLTIDQMDLLNHTWLMTGVSDVKLELVEDSGSEQVHFLKM